MHSFAVAGTDAGIIAAHAQGWCSLHTRPCWSDEATETHKGRIHFNERVYRPKPQHGPSLWGFCLFFQTSLLAWHTGKQPNITFEDFVIILNWLNRIRLMFLKQSSSTCVASWFCFISVLFFGELSDLWVPCWLRHSTRCSYRGWTGSLLHQSIGA